MTANRLIFELAEARGKSRKEFSEDVAVCQAILPIERARVLAPKMKLYYNSFIDTCALFDINTPLRMAHFLSQTMHESGNYRWKRELWGPTPQQKRYDGTSLAKRLGNKYPGDGLRYRGRGFIQVTGRHNYNQISKVLGYDFVANPSKLCENDFVFLSAGWYWDSRKINKLADADDLKAVTKKINGGYNGLDDRIAKFERASTALA